MILRKILKEPRVIILVIALLLSYITIGYQFDTSGVAIVHIEKNSSAEFYGLKAPSPKIQPIQREKIIEINSQAIEDLGDYAKAISELKPNDQVRIVTDQSSYTLLKDEGDLGITVTEVAKSNLRKGLELAGGTQVLLKPEGEVSEQDIKDIIDTMENRLNVYGLSDLKIKSARDISGEDMF